MTQPPVTSAHPSQFPAALERRGRELSNRFYGLIETSIRAAPEELRPAIRENSKDRTWQAKPKGPEDDPSRLFHSMMEERYTTLALMHGEFEALAQAVGWDERRVTAAANMLFPLIDVTERLCFTYYGHEYRAMQYAGLLLDYRKVEGPEKAEIMFSALMHDIGKAVAPGEILRRSGALIVQDYDILNNHPRYGREYHACRVCRPLRGRDWNRTAGGAISRNSLPAP